MIVRNPFVLSFLLILQSLLCFSQSDNWVNCLSHRQVNNLIEHNDLMYIATTGGVIIYDSATESITNLNRATSAIPSNYIIEMELDKDSTLWLMTDIGLCSYKDGNWEEYLDLNGLLTLDENGLINVATKTAYYFWNNNKFESLDSYPDLTFIEPYDIIVDTMNGDIWLSAAAAFAPGQVFRYSGGTWVDSDLNAYSYEVFDLAFDASNHLWCISDSDLYKYEDEWITKTELIVNINTYYFTSLGTDDLGNVYLSYTHPNNLTENYIYKIDSEENVEKYPIPKVNPKKRLTPRFLKTSIDNSTVFLGTINHGCMSYKEDSWTTLPIESNTFRTNYMHLDNTPHNGIYVKSVPYGYNGNHQFFNYQDMLWTDLSAEYPFTDANNFVVEFSEGIDQDLWMNFNGTLYHNELDSWTEASFPNIEQNMDESKSQIFFDNEDRQWLLGKEGHYILYDSPTGWKSFDKDQHGLIISNFSSIFNHPVTNDLWISGYQGVAIYKYDSDSWEFLHFNALGFTQSFLSLYIDADENIITTQGQNIVRFIDGPAIDTIASLTANPDIGSFFSVFLEVDTIWLGMKDAAAKYYDDKFEILDRSNSGIVNGYINSIARDENGNIWFASSSGGLAIYNENGLSEDFTDKDIVNGIKNEDSLLSFELFPNPFKSKLNLNLPDEIPFAQINIYNQMGQKVFSKYPILTRENIELDNFPSGLYFVEINDLKSKKKSLKKCIKL